MEIVKLSGIDECIYYTTAKCGLPIYVWKNEYAKSFYISLNVHYGSIHTEFSIDGKKYTIIRKEDVLEAPSNFEKTTINIELYP